MFKIVYRYILRNKKYSISAIIGIVVSTMLMFSMIQISASYIISYRSFISSGAPQDFYVVDLSYDELTAINDKFSNMGKDKPDRYLSTIYVGDMDYDLSKASVIMGYEGDLDYFKKTSLINGEYPSAENEICVEESYTISNPELKIGDDLTLVFTLTDQTDEKQLKVSRTFKVCGIIKDTMDTGNFFFTNLKTAADIYSENGLPCSKSNSITVEAEEGNLNEDKQVIAVNAISDIVVDGTPEDRRYFNYEQLIRNEEKTANYDEEGSFRAVSLGIFLLSLIIAVCLTIFVYNTITLSFARKISVFGTMRCIGLNNRQLIRFILYEQFIIVSAGTIIGMASGALLNLAVAEKIMSALINTAASMKVEQKVSTYLITYLLTLVSAFIACLKLILKIRKTNPVNIRTFNATKKMLTEKTKMFSSKNYLFGLAIRNLRRNFAKSAIQTVTLTVSFLLCLVISNVFAVVGFNSVKTAADFSDYSIQANITDLKSKNNSFNEADLDQLRSTDKVEKVYTEKCFVDYTWDKAEQQDEDGNLQVMLYDDELWTQFSKINGITYDGSDSFSVLISGNEYKEVEIYSRDTDNRFIVKPDHWFAAASQLNYALYHNSNTLIINEKLAESNNMENKGYCAFLVKTDRSMSELSAMTFSASDVYVTDLHDGRAESESQLIGMIIISGYIVIATIVLSFMIISNTIKENMTSRRSEYGVMRAMGLKLKDLWTVACYENLVLSLIAVLISIPLSLIVNVYISFVLFDKIKISILAYLLVNLIFIGAIELFAYFNIKGSTKDSIVEMIYER